VEVVEEEGTQIKEPRVETQGVTIKN